jgi:phosphoglycolate phosphatase-like HAD superfamily hydrolase
VIKAVLFDLDGTFADTAPDLAAALNHTRATRRLPPLPLEVLRPQCSHACLISGDTCTHPKPHPEPLLKACQIIGITPAQCLYLGDDLRDMHAANASGMQGIIANYGYVGSDASVANWGAHGSIDSPPELLRYLQ